MYKLIFPLLLILSTCSKDKHYEVGQIETPKGEILVWLHDETPNHKNSFIQLANNLEVNIILIWGSEAEKKEASHIAIEAFETKLAPKLTLPQLVALIDSVDLVIGNDTGPTHIAWAMNKPSITLFGPTPANKMMWQGTKHIAIESDSEVNPLKLDRSDMSIKDISAQLVYEKAQELLR